MGEGERLRNERRPEDALGPYERALQIWEGIVRDRPAISFYRAELAVTLAAIASIHQQGGRGEEARHAWRRTLDLGDPPRDGDAGVPFNMGRVYALGSTVDQARAGGLGGPGVGRAAGGPGLRLQGPPTDPREPRPRPAPWPPRLQGTRHRPDRPQGMALPARPGPSLASGGTSTRPSPSSRRPRRPWSRSSRRPLGPLSPPAELSLPDGAGGRPSSRARPRGTGRDGCSSPPLESLDSHDPLDWLAAARGHALCHEVEGRRGSASTSEEQAERTVGALRRAVTLGFRDPEFLASEPALRVLGDRPDFRALIADLAFPADPFGP